MKSVPLSRFIRCHIFDPKSMTVCSVFWLQSLDTNTYWIDVREGSDSCDLPEIGIIGEEFYKTIHKKHRSTNNRGVMSILDLWVQFFAFAILTSSYVKEV